MIFPNRPTGAKSISKWRKEGNATYDEHFRRLQDEAFVRPADADATPLTETVTTTTTTTTNSD